MDSKWSVEVSSASMSPSKATSDEVYGPKVVNLMPVSNEFLTTCSCLGQKEQ